MALNPWQFLVYPLALLCCWLGQRMALRFGNATWLAGLFAVLALPALCYDLYYLHLWGEPMWLYRIRSWPGSELFAAPAGLIAGWIQARLQGRWRISLYSMSALVLLAMAVPYVKQASGPMTLTEKWKDGVCLQSSASTCGPASAATLLAAMGIPASEAEIARDSYSTASGTENWYLRRAIEKRGISTRYVWVEPPVTQVPHPAIAGISLGKGFGHFIAILGEDAEGNILIADPLYGTSKMRNPSTATLTKEDSKFTGFFLVLEKRKGR